MRRLVLLTFVLCCAAPDARAATGTVAELPKSVPIGALNGWLVWNVPAAGGGWALSALHDGVPTPLAVTPRAHPFDLDLGTDKDGRVVATFSRCRKTFEQPFDFLSQTSIGCRVRVLDLTSSTERAGGIPRPAGSSDTMPSMWRGRLAFARHTPRKSVDQVMLWDPARRQARRLKHGSIPAECAGFEAPPCKRQPRNSAQVTALDLGRELAAFRWAVEGESVTGYVFSELRASSLDGRRSTLLAEGHAYEDCDESDSATTVSLGRPTIDGTAVWFSSEAQRCQSARTDLVQVQTTTRRHTRARIPANSLRRGITQVVLDRRRLFALIGRRESSDADGGCPCALQSLSIPTR